MSKFGLIVFALGLLVNSSASAQCLTKIETYCGYQDQEASCVVNEYGDCGGAEYYEGLNEGSYFDWTPVDWPLLGDQVQPEETYEFTSLHYDELDCGTFSFCEIIFDDNDNMVCTSYESSEMSEKVIQNSTTACDEL